LNNHRELIEEPLYQRIKDILNDGFLQIEELVDRLNDQSANKVLEKEVIVEVYDYSRFFYYLDGLVVSTDNEGLKIINTYLMNIDGLLKESIDRHYEGNIILYLLFFKRLVEFKNIQKSMQKKNLIIMEMMYILFVFLKLMMN